MGAQAAFAASFAGATSTTGEQTVKARPAAAAATARDGGARKPEAERVH